MAIFYSKMNRISTLNDNAKYIYLINKIIYLKKTIYIKFYPNKNINIFTKKKKK